MRGGETDLYADPLLAAIYDYTGTGPRADFAFCRTLAQGAATVLDLGCGTGRLAELLATGRGVVGVEPSAAMLEVARARSDAVNWVQADARTVRLNRRFDLVLLTGHSFQVFLTEADQRAVLATIACHLAPGGRFVFDTRNPDAPGSKERTAAETRRRIDHPELGPVEAWNVSAYDAANGILSYRNGYRVLATGLRREGAAQIRYTPQPALAAMLASAGLRVDAWLGDWEGRAFRPGSPEIIPVGGVV